MKIHRGFKHFKKHFSMFILDLFLQLGFKVPSIFFGLFVSNVNFLLEE